ncbi:MAG: CCA tRNA nucleotidyltransferase [Planctomycetota bacterium]
MKHIRVEIEKAGGRVFRFGGAVRDALMERDPRNLDFLVAGIETDALEEILSRYGTPRKTGDDIPFIAFRPTGTVDETATFTPARGESIADDLMRCDFTINAIATDLATGQTIDPKGGRADIERHFIRAVSDTVFNDSPTRLLRAAQLAVRLKFRIDAHTADVMHAASALSRSVPPEKIWPEVVRLITLGERPSFGIEIWRATGVLEEIMPELSGCDVKLGNKRIANVLDHLLVALDSTPSIKLQVRLAALLHDLGKPGTYNMDAEDEEESFIGHPVLGAKLAGNLLKRIGAPKEIASEIKHLIRNHMFNDSFDLSDSAVRRLLERAGRENIGDLFDLRFGDRIASGKPRLAMGRLGSLKTRIERMLDGAPDKPSIKDLAVNGKDIIDALGIEPGPEVGRILKELFERVLAEPELNDREKLLAIAGDLNKNK